ncbi:TonB-dependent receptor [uncultured Abyssibacter sp.]|uniref:TonB-dependent receptor n=1 Tax=uncultured Abyssibacter sp. TaxID=2320202 RepID=UPI0032B1505F
MNSNVVWQDNVGNRRLPAAAVVLTVLAAWSGVAVAQSAEPSDDPESELIVDTIPVDTGEGDERAPEPEQQSGSTLNLGTLVVSGDKLGRTLAESRTSVGLITGEAIDAGSDSNLQEVVSQIANVVIGNSDREISIRGVPNDGIGGEGDTISVYLDGVALPGQTGIYGGPLSVWDVEQVEVLRGPQSTTFGRNSIAGALTLTTRDPTPEWDLRARASRFSRDGHDYAVAGGGPITDGLRFRIAAQDSYARGDIYNVTRMEDDADRAAIENVRAKLEWLPLSDWLPGYRSLISYSASDNEFGDNIFDSTNEERTATADERFIGVFTTDVYTWEQSLPLGAWLTLESVTGFVDSVDDREWGYDRTEEDGGTTTFDRTTETFSQELRLQMRFDTVKAVIGAYFSDEDRYEATTGEGIPAAGGVVLLSGIQSSDRQAETSALFAELDWTLLDDWTVTLGGRLNREHDQRRDVAELEYTLTAPIPGLPFDIGVPLPDAVSDLLSQAQPDFVPPDYDVSGDETFTDFLPKVGLTWQYLPTHSVGVQYQQGYRSGGTSVTFFGGELSQFDPEYTRTTELALRNQWLDGALSVNANLFYTEWEDQQVTIGEETSFYTTTENAGESHQYGLEVESLVQLPYKLELFASLGLLRSEFDRFVNSGENYADNRFPLSPDESGSVGLTLTDWKGVSGQVSVNYVGDIDSYANNDPEGRVPSRTLLNAKIGYALPWGFSIQVFGRNLTDDVNLQGRFVNGEGEDQRVAKRYGEARTYGVSLSWEL